MSVAIIGVGSNLGSREASISVAYRLLQAQPELALTASSALYETPALGPVQPDYLNAAFRLETSLAPTALLALLLRTERRLGRVRHLDQRWGPRSLDLDLLWDERGEVDTRNLKLPHPGLAERAFALGPLLDVAPELRRQYGSTLASLGGSPPVWSRAAILEPCRDEPARTCSVQAEALVDAAALALQSCSAPPGLWRALPSATLHRVLAADPSALAEACSAVRARGFAVDCVSVSDCTESQWKVQLHGTAMGHAQGLDVRLATTSANERAYRVLVL